MTLPRSECIPNCNIHNKKRVFKESENNMMSLKHELAKKVKMRENQENGKKQEGTGSLSRAHGFSSELTCA